MTDTNKERFGFMSNEKKIVITVYGKNEAIDKIAFNIFDEASAKVYCTNVNSLVLQGAWIYSKIVYEHIQYPLDELPVKFDCILMLDNRSIQKVLREVDTQDLAKALKGTDKKTQDKVFINMSKKAAQMLKEDMEQMGPISTNDIKNAQEKILLIIRCLEGEIVTGRLVI
jgi:hypothetical protein